MFVTYVTPTLRQLRRASSLGKAGGLKRASTLYVDRGRIKHHILPLLGNLAKALSGRLRRLAPLLHAKGVNAEKLARTSAKRGWRLAPISAEEGKADLPSSPSSGSTATAACTDVPGAVIRNQQPVKENDDRDVSDDQFAGFSDRQHAMPVLSDIEAAYEEPRIRGDTVGPPVRRFRERKRTPLRPGKPLVYLTFDLISKGPPPNDFKYSDHGCQFGAVSLSPDKNELVVLAQCP